MKMSIVKFLSTPEYGCCTTAELMKFAREHKESYTTLKEWAKQEMTNRGIEIEEPVAK